MPEPTRPSQSGEPNKLIAELHERYGPATRNPGPPVRSRPPGVDDATVDALGRLSAALETAEDARGHLYSFHRLSGRADLDLQDAISALRDAGHAALADAVNAVMTGRNVIAGRWTFEIVEDYDANYLEPFRATERTARAVLDAPVHLAEAEMKAREQDNRQ